MGEERQKKKKLLNIIGYQLDNISWVYCPSGDLYQSVLEGLRKHQNERKTMTSRT